jgi:hypothetical protein
LKDWKSTKEGYEYDAMKIEGGKNLFEKKPKQKSKNKTIKRNL